MDFAPQSGFARSQKEFQSQKSNASNLSTVSPTPKRPKRQNSRGAQLRKVSASFHPTPARLRRCQ